MPKVSVIIPSYNHASFLREAMQAVLDQTYEDWELIVVDDCSPDDSYELAQAYRDPRIRVYRNEVNLHTYPTQSRGLDLANGECVAILSSDDMWGKAKLERQGAALDAAAEASFSYTRGVATDETLAPKEDPPHINLPSEPLQQ